mgnify:CR=1 FL=1
MNVNFIKKTKGMTLKNLKKEQKKYHDKKKEMFIIFSVFIIGITFFLGVSIGKAVHNTNIKNTTQIAKPILEVEKDSEIMITENNKKGEYHFMVKNFNHTDEISQVDLIYYIEILENNLDDSIQYELYKDDKKLELKTNKTEQMTFHKNVKEEQKYILKVTYDSSKNSMEDIMQEIQIKVHSEQLKI